MYLNYYLSTVICRYVHMQNDRYLIKFLKPQNDRYLIKNKKIRKLGHKEW